MSTQDKTGEIIKLLTELIALVKSTQPKVENHTHHHYPTNPQYHFPNQWTPNQWYTTGPGATTTNVPGTTSTWSTNDPGNNTNPE